ncbi:MAG: prolyl-tRNA synthetase associated domain-containing protein [Lachnospiraceae bacterium]|nr:prolyl-tRNA synthetase associated domain-containing protein [Lachnospiraceae bacterium]
MDRIIVEKGRPGDCTGRLPREIAVYDLLDSLGIQYQRADHEVKMTIEACADVDRAMDIRICKNLFLHNSKKTEFYLLMMPGEKKFVTKEVSRMVGSTRLSFADESYMEEYLNLTPGSVTILGLMNDKENRVHLLMDREVAESEYLGCHPCINTSSLKIPTKDILEKFLPAVHHEVQILDL